VVNVLYLDGIVGVVLIGFLLFCLLDIITSDAGEIRNLPKIVWVLLAFINPIGGIAWLIAGRPQADGRPGGMPYKGNAGPVRRSGRTAGFPEYERPRRSLAPDDDPEFLADLKRSASEHEQMLGSWEEDLRRREEELRRRDGKDDDAIG
jgi:hypothetical protein